MNKVSELHILIDWTCYFPKLEDNIIRPLQLIKKIKMSKLKDKKKIMSNFYNVNVDDFRGKTDFNIYILKDTDQDPGSELILSSQRDIPSA